MKNILQALPRQACSANLSCSNRQAQTDKKFQSGHPLDDSVLNEKVSGSSGHNSNITLNRSIYEKNAFM